MAAAVVVAFAGAAFACVPPALRLSPDSATPGSAVTVSGSARVQKEIVFHWNGTDGPVLARATPTESKFSATFTVPDAAPGYYLVTAVQLGNFDNTFIVRSSLQVLGPDGEAPVAPGAFSGGQGGTAESTPTSGESVAPFVLLLAAFAATGIGAVLLIGRRNRHVVALPESGE